MTTARALSAAGLAETMSERTSEVWFPVIELDHADWASPLRYARRIQDFDHDGNTYTAASFDVVLPTDVERERPEGTIEVDGTDGVVIAQVRNVTTPVTFTLKILRDSSPDDVEVGPFEGEVRTIGYGFTISATYEPEPVLSETYPAKSYDPPNFPGAFGLAAGAKQSEAA